MSSFDSAIVGQKFKPGAWDKIIATPAGTPVTLVREPDNQFDGNAIAVHIDGVPCGYIPAPQAKNLAPDIDGAEKEVSAVLTGDKAALKITVRKRQPEDDGQDQYQAAPQRDRRTPEFDDDPAI